MKENIAGPKLNALIPEKVIELNWDDFVIFVASQFICVLSRLTEFVSTNGKRRCYIRFVEHCFLNFGYNYAVE